MQKSLRLMNFRLDVVLNDITGVSGQAIIKAIIGGETNPQVLSELANYRVKKSREEIARALSYNGRKDYMYELEDSFLIYQSYLGRIEACDKHIEKLMRCQIARKQQPNKFAQTVAKKKDKQEFTQNTDS